MRSILFILSIFLVGAAGCSQPCDADHVCAVDSDGNLCDGSNWTACDAQAQGKTVRCAAEMKIAVCTPSGWTFQNPN